MAEATQKEKTLEALIKYRDHAQLLEDGDLDTYISVSSNDDARVFIAQEDHKHLRIQGVVLTTRQVEVLYEMINE